MPLLRLTYVSRATDQLSLPEFRDVLERSAVRNREQGITGLLLYGERQFLQVLEGDRTAVSSTFLRIATDTRHEAVELLEVVEVSTRFFTDWGMRLICLSHEDVRFKHLILRHSRTADFRPYNMSNRQCAELLQSVAKSLCDEHQSTSRPETSPVATASSSPEYGSNALGTEDQWHWETVTSTCQ